MIKIFCFILFINNILYKYKIESMKDKKNDKNASYQKEIIIVKTIYHLLSALLLLYLVFRSSLYIYIKVFLFLMMIFHFYDTYWFFTQDGNAPI